MWFRGLKFLKRAVCQQKMYALGLHINKRAFCEECSLYFKMKNESSDDVGMRGETRYALRTFRMTRIGLAARTRGDSFTERYSECSL